MNSLFYHQRLRNSYVFNATMADHYTELHQQYVQKKQWSKALFARFQMNLYKNNLNTCHASV